jgi:hypothetical protein
MVPESGKIYAQTDNEIDPKTRRNMAGVIQSRTSMRQP